MESILITLITLYDTTVHMCVCQWSYMLSVCLWGLLCVLGVFEKVTETKLITHWWMLKQAHLWSTFPIQNVWHCFSFTHSHWYATCTLDVFCLSFIHLHTNEYTGDSCLTQGHFYTCPLNPSHGANQFFVPCRDPTRTHARMHAHTHTQ